MNVPLVGAMTGAGSIHKEAAILRLSQVIFFEAFISSLRLLSASRTVNSPMQGNSRCMRSSGALDKGRLNQRPLWAE